MGYPHKPHYVYPQSHSWPLLPPPYASYPPLVYTPPLPIFVRLTTLIRYWYLYWPLERDRRRRYAPSKARGLTFRVSAQHIIRGCDGCKHGLHGHGWHDRAGQARRGRRGGRVGWEGVGAAGAENRRSSRPVEEGSVPMRVTRRKKGEE